MRMKIASPRRATSAECSDEGVTVIFDDGTCTFYPTDLFYAAYGLAKIMSEPEQIGELAKEVKNLQTFSLPIVSNEFRNAS